MIFTVKDLNKKIVNQFDYYAQHAKTKQVYASRKILGLLTKRVLVKNFQGFCVPIENKISINSIPNSGATSIRIKFYIYNSKICTLTYYKVDNKFTDSYPEIAKSY
jgi:hypothetical protein